jgi:hypothetical protein
MFTFGIFTTHIPYVAFVVFYAYFLIFGVEKASKGEIQAPGNTFKTELQASNFIILNDHSSFHYHSEANLVEHSNSEIFLFKRKIKHWMNATVFIHQLEYYTSLSNRPPPCMD